MKTRKLDAIARYVERMLQGSAPTTTNTHTA